MRTTVDNVRGILAPPLTEISRASLPGLAPSARALSTADRIGIERPLDRPLERPRGIDVRKARRTPAAARVRLMRNRLMWVARALLVAWAGFWSWFVVTVGLSAGPATWRYPGGALALLVILVGTTWIRPRAGAFLLLAFSAWSAFFFYGGTAALLGVALPALTLGTLVLVAAR